MLLPQNHLTLLALSFLDIPDISNVMKVNKSLNELVRGDVGFWKHLLHRDYPYKIGCVVGDSTVNPFLLKFKEEYSIPNCNGLGVTLECSRSESLPSREAFKRGFPISELKLKRVVARYNFTITLYNQTAAAMRVHSGFSNSQPCVEEGRCFILKIGEKDDDDIKYIGGFRCGTGARDTYYEIAKNEKEALNSLAYLVEVEKDSSNDGKWFRRPCKADTKYVLFFGELEDCCCEYCYEIGPELPIRIYAKFDRTNINKFRSVRVQCWEGILCSKPITLLSTN
jgi:hypothetical protein